MRLASDTILGNKPYFLSPFFPLFGLFDTFFLARFDPLVSWDVGEPARLLEGILGSDSG